MKIRFAQLVLLPFLILQTVNAGGETAVFPCEFRSIDARGNNPYNPEWGTPFELLDRLSEPEYADSIGSPSGADRPGAREISNGVVAQPRPIPAHENVSDYFWAWGQILDHDMDLTETNSSEPFNIPIPCGDPSFDPDSTCDQYFPFNRSIYEYKYGIREQINVLTSFIDGSMVYGSDTARANALRLFDGSGKLKTSEGNLLPFNTEGLPNMPDNSASFFLAGEARANENVALTALHTLFVREHNTWCDLIKMVMPFLTEDYIYEIARAMVVAEIQSITYREFLPLLLGPDALNEHYDYDPETEPSIFNEFSVACYRFGHSMLSNQLLRLDSNGVTIPQGNLLLRNAFLNPQEIIQNGGIEPLLFGLARQTAQEMDAYIVNGVRNFLFGNPGQGGFDLATLNIQRGRDHGLGNYNQIRTMLGLPPVSSFSDISSDDTVVQRLSNIYSSVNDIDLWVGGIAEDNYPGAIVGPTIRLVLKKQFERLKYCDRFWYKSYLPESLAWLIEQRSLSEIIIQNSNVNYYKFPRNAFIADTINYVTSVFPDLKIELREKCTEIVLLIAEEVKKLFTSAGKTAFKPVAKSAEIKFNGSGLIFSNPASQVVTIKAFSLDGREIATLVSGTRLSEGKHLLALPFKASGLVVIRAEAENMRLSKILSFTH